MKQIGVTLGATIKAKATLIPESLRLPWTLAGDGPSPFVIWCPAC